jgi:H+-transporting ATPase
MSIILGIVLAIGSWITLTTMFLPKGGIIQNFGAMNGIMFLQLSLTETWLIFIPRAAGPFWSSIPSWQLAGAVFAVDIIATMFTLFGWWSENWTDIVTVVRVWIWSIGIFCVLGGFYYEMSTSEAFDRLMNGKPMKEKKSTRSVEDFMAAMQRVSTQHEKET